MVMVGGDEGDILSESERWQIVVYDGECEW